MASVEALQDGVVCHNGVAMQLLPLEELDKKDCVPYTEEETAVLDKMKKDIGEEAVNSRPLEEVLRFIRGFRHEEKPTAPGVAATKRFRAYVDWRRENHVDTILEVAMPRWELYKQLWPSGYHGMDRTGHLIFVDRLGSTVPSELLKNFSVDEIIRFHIRVVEELILRREKLGRETGRHLQRHVIIVDLKGLGLAHISVKLYRHIRRGMDIDQFMYPETLTRMFVVNAPLIFRCFWKIMRPWVDPITRDKIFFGDKHLERFIEPECIPSFVKGGQCGCEDGKCCEVPFVRGRGKRSSPVPIRCETKQPDETASVRMATPSL